VHYLKRYFLLIAYRSFIDQAAATGPAAAAGVGGGRGAGGGGQGAAGPSFVKWMEERRELGHLLGHLDLAT
jgi:hypothetical protein